MASEECNVTIPPEIITDILYRLPAKSLGRFRCVSKGWLSLLTQPHFIKTHQNTLNQHHIILFSDDKSFYTSPFHHQEAVLSQTKVLVELPNFNTIKFYDSCEGLVLMSAYDFGGLHKLVVLNPTTKKFLELPESGYEKVDRMFGIHIMYAFCYDSVTDDYKVVTISYFNYIYLNIPPDTMSLHIYSLRTNTWKWLIDYPFNLYAWMELSNAFVNGCLHWLAKKGYDDVLPVIVAFSLADEKFSEVPIPYMGNNVDIMSKNSCKLVLLDGKLAILSKDEIWLMYEYGVKESWTKIVLGEIPMAEPMFIDDKCKLVLASSDRMLIHNLDEQTSSKTVVCIWSQKDLKVKATFVESLVSPKFS